MLEAQPEMTLRHPPVKKGAKPYLASSVLDTALPIRARCGPGRDPGVECPHPSVSPDHYFFYRWCIPVDRVPLQFLPWAQTAAQPHASFTHAWRTSEAGVAFFRLSPLEQAEALAAYAANPDTARVVAKPGPSSRPKSTISKKGRGGAQSSAGAARRRYLTDPADSDEASEDEDAAVALAAAEGMLPVLCPDQGRFGLAYETGLNTSSHAAQDDEWGGSASFQLCETRPEVVLQTAMTDAPLWAYAGVYGEGKRAERHLHHDVFTPLATFLPTKSRDFWPSYGRLIGQIVGWLEMSVPGGSEISDIAQGLRLLGEPRGHRVMGRAKSLRSNPTETQHLTSNPHGGGYRPPTDVVLLLEAGLLGVGCPQLTASRVLSAFASPIDSHTPYWLSFADFNGGVLPGLVAETNTIDAPATGPVLHHDHAYGPLQESVLHVMCHLATGAPLAGVRPQPDDAPPRAGPAAQGVSSAESVDELTSGQEQSGGDSDGAPSADRSYDAPATVAGPRLESLFKLQDRLAALLGAPAAAPEDGPLETSAAAGALAAVGLEAFQPAAATARWQFRTSVEHLMTLGTHVGPGVYLLMEWRYAAAGKHRKASAAKHPASTAEKTPKPPKACHQMYVDVYVSYPSLEEAQVHARGCAVEDMQRGPAGEAGLAGDGAPGFRGDGAPLPSIEAQLNYPVAGAHLGDPEAEREGEAELGRDRREAARRFLPACEAVLHGELAAALAGATAGSAPGADLPTSVRMPRRQSVFLRGKAGEWVVCGGEGLQHVRVVLAVVTSGTGAPDPRGAHQVVAAISEALQTAAPDPRAAGAPSRVKRTRAKEAEPPPPAPTPLRFPRDTCGLAVGPCRLLQRGSLAGRDTPDQPEDCGRTLRLARLERTPSRTHLMEYFCGRYVTSITAVRWMMYLTSVTAEGYQDLYPGGARPDLAYLGRPLFFAAHPSRHEPHVGAGSVEEEVTGLRKDQPVDFRQCELVSGLAGFTSVAQLALAMMGFSRDNGNEEPNAMLEVMGLAKAVPRELRKPGGSWAELDQVPLPDPPSPSPPHRAPTRAPAWQAPGSTTMLPGSEGLIIRLARTGFATATGRRAR